MFQLFRYFSVASLFAFVLVTVLLMWLYRQAAIQDLLRIEQGKNIALTRTFANMLWPTFAEFFRNSEMLSDDELRSSAQIKALDATIQAVTQGNDILKVKIYGLDGRTLYSTLSAQIGENQRHNPAWQAAVNGQIGHEFVRHDLFYTIGGSVEDRYVIGSYIPMRRSEDAPVEAVFELYGDVTDLMAEIDLLQLRMGGGIVIIVGLLYVVQLAFVRHAEKIIHQQYAERARAERELRRRVELDELILQVSTRLAAPITDDQESNIALALAEIGKANQLHVVMAATFDEADCIDDIFVWSQAPTMGDVADISSELGSLTWLRTRMQEDIFLWDDSTLPPEAVAERRLYIAYKLEAVLFRPLVYGREVLGFLVLSACDGQSLLSPEVKDLTVIVADLIATAIVKQRTERSLAESEKRLRALMHSMKDVVFTIDTAGRYTGFYGRGIEDFGYDETAAIGKRSSDLFEPAIAVLFEQAIEQALRGENIVFEWKLTTIEGFVIHLQTSLSPVWSLTGAVIGAVGVGRDISEIKRLERVKSEFVANVSHELRTPLASILGYSELLLHKRPGPLTEVQKEFIHTILESSKRLKLLVDDLLDISRIDVGNFRMRMDDVNLDEIIRNGLELIKPVAAKASVAIVALLPARLPLIEADGERISQVIDNLLSNAVKFSNAGGRVYVEASDEDAGVNISVRDEGIGIPEEEIPFLFSRFYRATNADQNSRSGTGLGLYISKAIIDAHGGRIAVESRRGHGTAFRVWLPKQQVSPLDISPDQLVTEIVDRYFTTP